ncbi:TPA: hypothetical protein DEP34_02415 [Candidatus Uhrbacteria bacterium]|uniref:Putative tRNA threonylcarbamoyladenosine biosynthesis protein Gcp n=2 Tax=Candidatus Uhriibacteriota TaxID=1752732 RepID=A0A0G1T6Y5_9BACT|nr:MAG: putative tRNA threonylcarbamoyladenosine biosynthesis protein Gcp [Candidatus Uhrbacteria bacterium GW2011_GWF2_46_218]KKU41115.1 MAG: putative tRNA threonylcarbamoyladenosine biosynthesis protein Gcp [Candidatus Uhrbacteria bacterium GW2011_GWE2_46_68]HBK34296.1 hypothetical protein [Candidatus Uhrbacteria bacterium]HCB19217.1 hypothetical protein [Candidatus Uhrbacteria bacterium]
MFTLLIRAQDIHFFEIGLGQNNFLLQQKREELSPEQLLLCITQALEQWHISQAHISKMIVVTGPGSCTASRMSVTIANTFAYVHHLPLVALSADPQESLIQIWTRALVEPARIVAMPTYTQKPHITFSYS